MKKLVSFLSAGALVIALMTTSSCTKTCDAGYEGSDCKTETRAKFENSAWSVSETKNAGNAYTYSSSIGASSSDVSKVLITKVANGFFNSNVVGTISGTAITIASQTPDNDGYTISGQGTIVNNTLTLTYTISGLNSATPPVTVTDNYSGTWTHQ